MFAAVALSLALALAPKPHIVWKPIPYGPKRKAEMAAYARRHYGIHSWRLHPKVIVEHYSGSNSFSSTWNAFSADRPDPELGQLPGTCAHFVVDRDGTIYQLVHLNVMCRHTVGLNYVALGIEHVGTSDAEILHDPAQLRASLALAAWLVGRFHIRIRNVIGHNESLSSPYHREFYKPWARQTHGDWNHADMRVYRAKLRALLVGERNSARPRARSRARFVLFLPFSRWTGRFSPDLPQPNPPSARSERETASPVRAVPFSGRRAQLFARAGR